jgi:hypothetical protein
MNGITYTNSKCTVLNCTDHCCASDGLCSGTRNGTFHNCTYTYNAEVQLPGGITVSSESLAALGLGSVSTFTLVFGVAIFLYKKFFGKKDKKGKEDED